MDKKVELKLLSVAGAQNNARIFALIMGEKDGTRYFPILVNESEAQSVVVMTQNVQAERPLIHDVYADFLTLSEDGMKLEAKAADAIALSLRFSCPIYALDSVVEAENIVPDVNRAVRRSVGEEIDRLKKKLQRAISAEDYETAAKLRDIIKELSANGQEDEND